VTDGNKRAFSAVDELVQGYVARTVDSADATELIAKIRASRHANALHVETSRSDRDQRIGFNNFDPVGHGVPESIGAGIHLGCDDSARGVGRICGWTPCWSAFSSRFGCPTGCRFRTCPRY
jgi:hypothetical protein